MQIGLFMSRSVELVRPDSTLKEAAASMARLDFGVLPVGDADRLVGMVTDRDIAVRGVAAGRGPETPIREVMTPNVKYCSKTKTPSTSPKTWRRCRSGGCR
jgi:CBS domain-containing protein